MISRTDSSLMLITMFLPGPSRKRAPAPYHYQVSYRNRNPEEPGCVATWEVLGGREQYQISLELTEDGELRWHCTCPDAVYRGELTKDHRCKHVHGLLDVCETISPLAGQKPVAA